MAWWVISLQLRDDVKNYSFWSTCFAAPAKWWSSAQLYIFLRAELPKFNLFDKLEQSSKTRSRAVPNTPLTTHHTCQSSSTPPPKDLPSKYLTKAKFAWKFYNKAPIRQYL
jgi:hypothetical protein